jgi:hypothetical protein
MESNGEMRLSTSIDVLLERLYHYHGEIHEPSEVSTDIWATPAGLPPEAPDTRDYFLHYFQSQGWGPTMNECVTTSTVMAMNMMEDRIACAAGGGPLQFLADLRLEDYIEALEARGLAGWRYRFPTRSPLPGMMPPWGARRAMREHSAALKRRYGRGYRVQTRSHLTVNDLVRALEERQIVLIHGAWPKKLGDSRDAHLALLGGLPHTMLLAGYESGEGMWHLLNPGDPLIKSREPAYQPRLYHMSTGQLMDFWGRRFLFYPPRCSITTLREE